MDYYSSCTLVLYCECGHQDTRDNRLLPPLYYINLSIFAYLGIIIGLFFDDLLIGVCNYILLLFIHVVIEAIQELRLNFFQSCPKCRATLEIKNLVNEPQIAIHRNACIFNFYAIGIFFTVEHLWQTGNWAPLILLCLSFSIAVLFEYFSE